MLDKQCSYSLTYYNGTVTKKLSFQQNRSKFYLSLVRSQGVVHFCDKFERVQRHDAVIVVCRQQQRCRVLFDALPFQWEWR